MEEAEEIIAPELNSRFDRLDPGAGLADKVASAVADSIMAGRLEPGDKLPSERELGEIFGVSRPVVREAVRSLTAKGLLADKPRHGHVVQALGQDTVTESLTLYLRGQRLDYGKLMEVRALVEVENAGLAASRASTEQVAILRTAAARLQVGLPAEQAALADTEFHRAIATATDNAFFEILIDSIREVLLTVQVPTLSDEVIVRRAQDAHRLIVERIAAGDVDGARQAMREHLAEAERGMRAVLRSDPARAQLA
ncbi:MAG TPA: FadR/GntR family transcriptional regulator [Solirubrobacteraceae bacterium]|jgi:GntR family transcriptional repressor for pyruvate dehydrogenase complex|nr:FadR/GntR family transcriptional regulator [Solirubrobacteraceae bacterium]